MTARWRCTRALDQDANTGEQRLRRNNNRPMRLAAGNLLGHLRDKSFERIATFEDDVDDLQIDRELVIAREIQEGFQLVREVLHGNQIQETRTAFEGMERPEDGVQRIRVLWILLERPHAQLDVLQMLGGLIDKLVQQFAIALDVHHERLLRWQDRRRRRRRR